jgi:hypothetical protein
MAGSARVKLIAAGAFVLLAAVIAHGATFTVNDRGTAGDDNRGDCVCHTAGGVCTMVAAQQESESCPGTDTVNVTSGLALTPSGDLFFGAPVHLVCLGARCCTGIDCGSAAWPTTINFGNAPGGIKLVGDGSTIHGCDVAGVAGSDSNAYAVSLQGASSSATCVNAHDSWGGIIAVGPGASIGGRTSGDAVWVHRNHFGATLIVDNTSINSSLSGTTADGLSADANAVCLYLEGGKNLVVDGVLASGCTDVGIYIKDASVVDAKIQNSLIGRNRTDNADLCNRAQVQDHGSGTTVSGSNIIADCVAPTAATVDTPTPVAPN